MIEIIPFVNCLEPGSCFQITSASIVRTAYGSWDLDLDSYTIFKLVYD